MARSSGVEARVKMLKRHSQRITHWESDMWTKGERGKDREPRRYWGSEWGISREKDSWVVNKLACLEWINTSNSTGNCFLEVVGLWRWSQNLTARWEDWFSLRLTWGAICRFQWWSEGSDSLQQNTLTTLLRVWGSGNGEGNGGPERKWDWSRGCPHNPSDLTQSDSRKGHEKCSFSAYILIILKVEIR